MTIGWMSKEIDNREDGFRGSRFVVVELKRKSSVVSTVKGYVRSYRMINGGSDWIDGLRRDRIKRERRSNWRLLQARYSKSCRDNKS